MNECIALLPMQLQPASNRLGNVSRLILHASRSVFLLLLASRSALPHTAKCFLPAAEVTHLSAFYFFLFENITLEQSGELQLSKVLCGIFFILNNSESAHNKQGLFLIKTNSWEMVNSNFFSFLWLTLPLPQILEGVPVLHLSFLASEYKETLHVKG